MKCYYKNCKKNTSGHKQFNDVIIRIVGCFEHLDLISNISTWKEFKEKIK